MRGTKSGAAILSVVSNSLLIVLKVAAGLLTGSIAILTEAVHSAIDLLASIIALISVRKADEPADPTHAEYHRRFRRLRPLLPDPGDDWPAAALRFVACADGVDCVIVGGTNARHVERNVAAVARGPLEAGLREALHDAFARLGADWRGIV